MATTALLLLALVGWCSLALECNKSLYFSKPANLCVAECPCGYFGDSADQECHNVSSSSGTVFFNQTEYDLYSFPINISAGTKLGTTWISLPLELVYFNESHLDSLSSVSITISFGGVIFNSSVIPQSRSFGQSYFDVGIGGKIVTVKGSGWIENLQLSIDDVIACEEYFLLPIDLFAGPGFAGVGINQFSLLVFFYHAESDSFLLPTTRVSIFVYSVCSSEQYYVASSGQCVSECPCGTTVYPEFCYEAKDQVVVISPGVDGFELDPQTPKGTLISKYTLYFNVSDGSPLMNFNESGMLEMFVQSNPVRHSASEGPSTSTEFLYHYHYYKAQFGVKLPGVKEATLVNVTGPIDMILSLSNPTIKTCFRAGSAFIMVPVEIYLWSPFFYHLGLQWLSLELILSKGIPKQYLAVLDSYLFISIGAECPDHLHYDFDSGDCVSECPCGFIGFDYHYPNYCEPAPAEAAWEGYIHQDEQSPARFAESVYSLALPWSNPLLTETVPIKVFVYLESTRLYNSYDSLTNDSLIIAHVEAMYISSNHVEMVQGSGIDAPMLELLGPTLPGNAIETALNSSGTKVDLLLRNSSQYGLVYCYDDLQDRLVGYIPITVAVTSPEQYSLLANHTFVLRMTFSVQNDPSIQLPPDTSTFIVSIIAGDLGQTPFPPRMEPLVAGKDFYPFVDIEKFDHEDLEATLDGASNIIGIPIGLPFGATIQTEAYVGVNGVISFNEKWHFWQADRFPTVNPWSRVSYIVAPFWNDHDLRKSGSVRYAIVDVTQGEFLLKNISDFIQLNHEQAAEDQFEGTWMLVAHWDQVHPYPHGSYYSTTIKYYNDYIDRQNSYQAIVITNGADSYALFTYNCDQMEWTGYWQHGVVGYNAEGDFYDNHAASGFEVVDTAVACANDMYGSPWNNLVYKISLTPDSQLIAKKECLWLIRKDEERLQSIGTNVQQQLEPCPCSLWQAQGDFARFQRENASSTCYVQRFPVRSDIPEGIASLSQECCYSAQGTDQFGSLISNDLYAGTMLLYHPILSYSDYVIYDKTLRDMCCTAGLCHQFIELRQSQNCSGYEAPEWAWGYGDLHITTLDGRSYTFNGWGEYVLMEYIPQNSSSPMFVMQVRTTSVNDSNLNAATKFSAFAFGIPGQLSFQVELKDGSFHTIASADGISEDIIGPLTDSGCIYNSTDGTTEIIHKAGVSVLAAFSNGVGVTVNVTSGLLNFILSLPPSFKSRTTGLLGNYNSNMMDEFTPRNENSPLSNDISDREIHSFGQTWAVTEEESLFIYSFPKENYSSLQFPNHQPIFVDEFSPSPEQTEVCGGHQQCEYDYAQTGSKEIGLATKAIQTSNAKNEALFANYPPRVVGDTVFHVTVGHESFYTFSVTDSDGNFSVGVVGGLPMYSTLVSKGKIVFEFQLTLKTPSNLALTFFAKDSLNASSTLGPRVEVCACANGGECTLEGLLSTDANTVIMNCICTQAFDGEFCEEDRNGCLDTVCYEGVECLDVPAPGLGAICGPCPSGLTGIVEDEYKCFDMNECAVNPTVCEQQCVNVQGGYTCSCSEGFRPDSGGNCQDIDECLESNGCQQSCHNSRGSYVCNCSEGFELAADRKSCNVLADCTKSHSCSQICAIVGSVESCSCNVGYELDEESDTYCVDKNECELYSPCDQECTNLPGSFECSCKEGYELHEDGVTCTDINECLEEAIYSLQLCAGNTTCVNSEGGYECVCVSGYFPVYGCCHRDVEPPVVVLQSFPSLAAENALFVIVTGLVPSTFSSDKKQAFRRTTAELVNNYCLENICPMVIGLDRRRSQAVIVEPKHVALQNIAEDSEGRLVFYVYVELEEGILILEVIQNALQEEELKYIESVDSLSSIMFVGVLIPPTINSPSPSPSTSPIPEEGKTSVLEILVITMGTLLVVLLVLSFIIILSWALMKSCQRWKRSYRVPFEQAVNFKMHSIPNAYMESAI